MGGIEYSIKTLCDRSQLGEIISAPIPIEGGLLHRMYGIETNKGKYAIKHLNPEIIRRPSAMENYRNLERIAHHVSRNIRALPAKKIDKTFIQNIDNQYFLVFDWIEGRSLKSHEINLKHSEQIGAILGDIHKTGFEELRIHYDRFNHKQLIDWEIYLLKGQENQTEWVELLYHNISNLKEWEAKANQAAESLASNVVISHRDLDLKNVMWHKGEPTIIDWESAGYINPMEDLINTAIYWSENEQGTIDKERFFSFMYGYKKRCGRVDANWSVVLAKGFSGKLDWLEFNLKRSLWMECKDSEEQKLGTAQVMDTIDELNRYDEMITKLVYWLEKDI